MTFQALDPNIKMAYAEDKWQEEFYSASLQRLEEVVSQSNVTFDGIILIMLLPV
jgi:hypothetical protein